MEKMQALKQNQHGAYTEIFDEKEVIRVTASVKENIYRVINLRFLS